MRATAFYRAVTVDHTDLLQDVIQSLTIHHIPYCVIGGQGVNAYAEPLVSLDLDVVVSIDRIEDVLHALPTGIEVERFPHSLNLSKAGSDLRVPIQLDPRYAPFPARSTLRMVLRVEMSVAAIEDVLDGKVWAAADTARRASKRQKDLADIARLLERHPQLRARVPKAILDKLL
jgi:hypothetical protein